MGVMNQGKSCAEISSIIIQNSAANLLQPSVKPRIYGHSEAGCNTKASAPATMPWTMAFKGAKTIKHGFVNKYDVMPAGRMQVDDVITTCHSNCHLTTWPTGATTNTTSSGSPRDHPHLQPVPAPCIPTWTPTWPSATNVAAPAGKINQGLQTKA